MTARQSELFSKPKRQTRGQLMHVCDAGNGEEGALICELECRKCRYRSGWLRFDTVTEAKRGLPCPSCNASEQEA